MKPRVYIETTIPSYLVARPSRDVIQSFHQRFTREWWTRREAYELFVSRLVIQECHGGNAQAAADRLAALAGIPALEQDSRTEALAEKLIRDGPLPKQAVADANHIALAAVHEIDYLLTWNCKHIANITIQSRIAAACAAMGCKSPLICTPEQFPLEEHRDD